MPFWAFSGLCTTHDIKLTQAPYLVVDTGEIMLGNPRKAPTNSPFVLPRDRRTMGNLLKTTYCAAKKTLSPRKLPPIRQVPSEAESAGIAITTLPEPEPPGKSSLMSKKEFGGTAKVSPER